MGWHELAFVFTDIPQLFQRNDDDMYDRLSHRWSAAQLILFSLLVTTSSYVGDPIHCWVPAHFHGSWEKFTDQYCWVRNTYSLPFENNIPKEIPDRDNRQIIYYQWVPLILMIQALMFYFPIVFWRTMNDRTGVDMNDIIETAEKFQQASEPDAKSKLLNFLTKQAHRYLGVSKKPAQNRWSPRWLLTHCFCVCCGKSFGNYVTALYIFVKVIFLVNVLGQLWMLNLFLGQNYANYGFEVVSAMSRGEDWTQSERFPRVTLCDLFIRRLGNNHRYSVQCVLTINLFNEKIYLYIWFWFLLVAAFTLIGLVLLLFRVFMKSDKERYIEKHIMLGDHTHFNPDKTEHRRLLEDFVHKYLRQDGVLLMRLVGHNTNSVTVTDLISALFEYYCDLPHVRKGLEARTGSEDHVGLIDSVDSGHEVN